MARRARNPKRQQAEEILNQGLDLLDRGDEEGAGRYFSKSIDVDPNYADGYNHLGNIAYRNGDWAQAEGRYRQAFVLAKPEIRHVRVGQYWGRLESRPYMRAFHGLGLTASKQGRLKEAIGIFTRMLKLNPNDNQGARYLIGSLYHQSGDTRRAIRWYRKTGDDPHNLYNYGLALIQEHKFKMAGKILIHAISTNPYIAAMLLDKDLPETDWWHGTSWAEPDYATDYIVEHGEWWDEEALPMSFLSTIWASPEVQQTLKDFINTRRAITKAQSGDERVSLGRASEALWGTESIRKLASEMCKTFGDGGLPR